MDKATLLKFIERILAHGSEEKSAASLGQLLEILKAQNAKADMIRLVEETLDSLIEAKQEARQPTFSEEALRTAIERARKRKRWEAEMANRGRCG